MDTDKTALKLFLSSLVMIIVVEFVFGKALKIMGLPNALVHPLVLVGVVRILEIGGMLLLAYGMAKDLSVVGLGKDRIIPGLKAGVVWSIGFGVIAGIAGAVLYISGINPFKLVAVTFPEGITGLTLLFIVGGFIGPVAEEIFFRGICYRYFRKWGILSGIIVTTGIFVVAHSLKNNLPIPQIIGGVVFALSYEYSKSLVSPIIIHIAGNLAIFSLPFCNCLG